MPWVTRDRNRAWMGPPGPQVVHGWQDTCLGFWMQGRATAWGAFPIRGEFARGGALSLPSDMPGNEDRRRPCLKARDTGRSPRTPVPRNYPIAPGRAAQAPRALVLPAAPVGGSSDLMRTDSAQTFGEIGPSLSEHRLRDAAEHHCGAPCLRQRTDSTIGGENIPVTIEACSPVTTPGAVPT